MATNRFDEVQLITCPEVEHAFRRARQERFDCHADLVIGDDPQLT